MRFSRPFEGEDDRYLAVLHNLSEDNLFASARLGGLAVPSLAITDVRNLYGIYGEITLIGDPSLADPQQPGNKVFSTDVYSPVFPKVVLRGNRKSFSSFYDDVFELSNMGKFADLSKADLRSPSLFHFGFFEKETLWNAFYNSEPETESVSEMRKWLDALLAEHGLWYAIRSGRRFVPLTLENLVSVLSGNLRNGTILFDYDIGNIRANAAREYSSFSDVKADRERVVSFEDSSNLEKTLKKELNDLVALFGSKSFSDFYKMVGDHASRKPNAFSQLNPLPPGGIARVDAFLSKVREASVHYFEAKPQRAVRLDEFKAAVVPYDSAPAVFSLLRDKGIDVFEYETGNERQAKTLRAADSLNLCFSRPFSGPEFEAELAAAEARHTNADGTRRAT